MMYFYPSLSLTVSVYTCVLAYVSPSMKARVFRWSRISLRACLFADLNVPLHGASLAFSLLTPRVL